MPMAATTWPRVRPSARSVVDSRCRSRMLSASPTATPTTATSTVAPTSPRATVLVSATDPLQLGAEVGRGEHLHVGSGPTVRATALRSASTETPGAGSARISRTPAASAAIRGRSCGCTVTGCSTPLDR